MYRSILTLGVLLCVIAPTVAQTEARKTEKLLQTYLQEKGTSKAKARAELVATDAPSLRTAITEIQYSSPKQTGVVEFETECPDGHQRPYWVYIPEEYEPTKKYPLVVCLHGSCAQMPMRWDDGNGAPGLFALNYWKSNLSEDWENEVLLLGCAAGVPETTRDAVWYFKGGEENVLHMVAETKRQLNVDDNRVFVSGHSDGGNGSFGFAFRRPDTFAGFLPMCGNPTVPMLDRTPIWYENLKGSYIYAFNGAQDDLYPGAEMTRIYDRANQFGAAIKYTVHEELTHDIRPVVAEEVSESLTKRIAKWKRNLTPSEIDWTCVDTERGRRAWLSIDEVADLGDANVVPENAGLGGGIRLGIGLDENAEHPTVGNVEDNTPAADAGLKVGDVFRKFDSHEIKSIQDLITALRAKSEGDEFTIVVERDGNEKKLTGEFAANKPSEAWSSPNKARLQATWEQGRVELSISNASRVSLYVFPALLDADGKFKLILNPGTDFERNLEFGPIQSDNEFVLDQFEATHDRSLPWINRVEIDIEVLLSE